MAKISIVIPVYKVEKVLKRCVDSVLSQTYTDYEVILVDDGSPDTCGDICNDYADAHENILAIHQKNGGLSAARNTGLQKARGEYVMFLDSDDYLASDCLETLCRHDADLIIGTITFAFENKDDIDQKPREDGMILRDDFAKLLPALLDERRLNYIHAKLFKRSIIEAHRLAFEDDMLTSAEDTVFNFTYLQYCSSIYVSAKPVHFYVQSSSGLGQRFYPDRYQRYCRLNDFIADTCKKMDVYSDGMDAGISARMCRSAIWSMNGILEENSLGGSEKIELLDAIAVDMRLRGYAFEKDSRDAENLDYLIKSGGKKLLSRYTRAEFYEKVRYKLGIH